MQPRQVLPEVQVPGQPQTQSRRPSIAREFLTAGIALWLILTSTKLLLYTTNLYHSTDFEVHRNWLAITHHPYYELAPKPAEVRDRPSEVVPDHPHGSGEPSRSDAEVDGTKLPKGWKFFSAELSRYVQDISWIRDARYWYREGQYSIWTLDYPPLFALFECFLSRTVVPAAQGIAPLILHKQSPGNAASSSTGFSRASWWNASYVVEELDRMVTLSETENASPIVQYFQRATVIVFSDWPLHLSLVLFCTLLVRRVRDRNLYRWRRIHRTGSPSSVKRGGEGGKATTILAKPESRDDFQTGSQSDTSTGVASRVKTRPTPQGVIQAKRESTWLLASLPPISQPWLSGMACSLILCITLHPIFIMVDAVHFQYNSLLFALLVLSSLFVLFGHVATAAFLFVSLIFAKHLFLYYSLGLAAWGLWLVWKTLTRPENGSTIVTRLVKAILLVTRCLLAAALAATLALFPFFVSETLHQYETVNGPLKFVPPSDAQEGLQAIGQGILRTAPILLDFLAQPKRFESVARETVTPMVERMFPFGRGLCHSFWAPNAYPILNVIDRLACKYMTIQHRSRGLHNTAKALDDPENIKAAQFASLPSHAIIGDITPFVSNCLVLTCFIVGLTRHQFRFSSSTTEQSTEATSETDAKKKETKGKAATPQSPPTPTEKKSSTPTKNPYREGLTNLRALLWLLFASSGSFFLFGFHVHEKAILTVLFPIFLLAMLAMAEYVETQRHLRFTLQELVEETAVQEAAAGRSADSPVPLNKDSPSSKALVELTKRLIKQVYYFSMVVRRIRVLLALAVVLSFAGGLTVLPLLYEFREIPLKYCLVLGHVACLLMIDCHVCIAGLRHLEVIHHICGSDATIQKVIQSQSAMALRPLLSAFEKTLLFLVMLPVAIYADATTVLADWRGRPTEFLPLLLLSLCGSLVLVNAIFFKGARIAGA